MTFVVIGALRIKMLAKYLHPQNCLFIGYGGIKAISVNPALREQSVLDLHCLSRRSLKHCSRRQMQTTFVVICTLRVNKCEFNVYTVMIFMKCMHVCQLKQLINSLPH